MIIKTEKVDFSISRQNVWFIKNKQKKTLKSLSSRPEVLAKGNVFITWVWMYNHINSLILFNIHSDNLPT